MNRKTVPDNLAPTSTVRVITLNRLSLPAYAALEKATHGKLPLVPANPHDATFRAGVEFVLRSLREGYVIEDQQ